MLTSLLFQVAGPAGFLREKLPQSIPDLVVYDVIWPLIQIAVALFVVMTLIAYLTLAERKISAWIQIRMGPMRVGPWGLLQPAADGLKLLIKEDIVPILADKAVFTIAPIISMVVAVAVLVVIPYGTGWAPITDVNIALLFVLAVSSVGTLGIILGGWASNSKYPLLGALRSSAQMISYEVAMGLALIGPLMFSKTLSLVGIINAQTADHTWYILYQPLGFLVYFIAALAETNRAPFDLPEAESELTGGFHTEYSGFRFSLYFIAEYAAMFTVSAVAVTIFLGGGEVGGLIGFVMNDKLHLPESLYVLVTILVFFGKILAVLWAFMWFRWTFPRYRYDQLMDVGWKWLIPAALANIVLTGILFVIGHELDKPFLTTSGDYLLTVGWVGKVYTIGTAFIVTLPITAMLLSTLNKRSRDFNLRTQRQLQLQRKQERLAGSEAGD
jgi:NADH-quinone oxidoreductase subunit H